MLLNDNYIFLDVDVNTKEEMLEFIAKKAVEVGISTDEKKLLEDLLARENEVSTGLQDGFAIPHSRSTSILEPSIMYFKTNKTLEWGSLDDSEVNCIFSLLVPAENENNMHMQMLSKLATCLIEEDFRDYVKNANDVQDIKNYLLKNMEVE